MLHEQLLHEIDVHFLPSSIFPLQHLTTAPREEREVVQQHRMPFVLRGDLHEVAAILEEIAREGDRLAVLETVHAEDGEVGVERDEKGVERLVYFQGGRDAAE